MDWLQSNPSGEAAWYLAFEIQRGGGDVAGSISILPVKIVIDSKVTTYENLVKLDRDGVKFITIRRRSKNLLAKVTSLAPESWQEVNLKNTARKYTKVKVHDSAVKLPTVKHFFRQLTITEHGREKPTFILTNEWDWDSAQIITQYGRR